MGTLFDSLPGLREETLEVDGFKFKVRGLSLKERVYFADLSDGGTGEALSFAATVAVMDPETGEPLFGADTPIDKVDSELVMKLAAKVMELSSMGKEEASE